MVESIRAGDGCAGGIQKFKRLRFEKSRCQVQVGAHRT